MTPYSHEPSWFAAIRHISGKGTGYIVAKPYIEPDKPGAYVYLDGCTDQLSPDKIRKLLNNCLTVLEPTGVLIASVLPIHAEFVTSCLKDMIVIEQNMVDGRAFMVLSRIGTPKPLPEVVIFRNGNAIGDAIYVSAVASEYARSGFSMLVLAMECNRHVYANNPAIQEFVPLPDFDAGVMNRLADFWSKRVRVFVNLDWSIEGHLLKKNFVHGYFWSDLQRRAMCGIPYAQNVARQAGLQSITLKHFPGTDDVSAANMVVDKIGNEFIFLHLAGSGGVHKWWPYWKELVMMLLSKTKYSIYLSFGRDGTEHFHKIMEHVEQNHGKTDRIHVTNNKRSFSINVEIARQSACVVAPETGLPTALAHEDKVPKVLMLSHSADKNFADWKNTVFMQAGTERAPCQPCHRIHIDHTHCPLHVATGAALCQAVVPPAEVYDLIMEKVV